MNELPLLLARGEGRVRIRKLSLLRVLNHPHLNPLPSKGEVAQSSGVGQRKICRATASVAPQGGAPALHPLISFARPPRTRRGAALVFLVWQVSDRRTVAQSHKTLPGSERSRCPMRRSFRR